jgi:ABC-2 type transport system ATP-binding protein
MTSPPLARKSSAPDSPGNSGIVSWSGSKGRPPVGIEIEDLTKVFRQKKKRDGGRTPGAHEPDLLAVNRANLQVNAGELLGLLGPNGAGKTTLVKCLSTLLLPDAGTARIFGSDIVRQAYDVRRKIGLTTGGERTLYWKLSATDNLRYFAALYGLTKGATEARIGYLLDIMDLGGRGSERIEKFSTGMRQKVSIARAIIHDPQVLLLDEPTLGLDPQFSRTLRGFIREELCRKQGKTILLTTHYMDEADELCDRVAFMNEGRIVTVDSPGRLKETIPYARILEIRCQGGIAEGGFLRVPGITQAYVQRDNGTSTIRIQAENAEAVLSEAIDVARGQARILSVSVTAPTLEDVFIHLTGVKLSAT